MKKLCLFLALVLLVNILPVNLAMAETLAITQQPKNVVVASGETAKVSVTATGDGLSYLWYYADKGTTTFRASSVTTASYSLTMNSTRSGRRVYCVVTDKYGKKVISNTVTLSIATPLKITKQPTNVTVASGATAKVSVTATGDGLSYRWYYAEKGSSTFSATSVTTSSYSLTMSSARSGRRVYCVITDKYGKKVTSSTVTLSMATPLAITKQPVNVTVASGATAKVSVAATGDGLSYLWYYADKGTTTFRASSVTTASYSLTMSSTRSGRRVYCVITDKYGKKVTSNTVTLSMATPLAITKQPTNVTVASGATAKVSVTATGEGLSYRWYYAEKGSSTFSATSVTTSSYSLAMNSARSGRRVYCVVTDKYGKKVTSNTVTLSMATPLAITKQPTNVTVASGATAKVSVTATGEGLSYRWYYAEKGFSTFSATSVTTSSYSLAMNSTRSGRRVYCVVTDKYGKKVTSNTVTLSMAAPITITRQPTNVTVASGDTATVSVAATGDGLSYRWYYANKGSSTFSATSITTSSYSLDMTESRSGRQLYCEITDKYGQKVKTNVVTLIMSAPIPKGLVYSISNGSVTITDYTGSASTLSIPSEIEGYPVRAIGKDALADCTSLTSITLPNTITSIGYGAFAYCERLKSINLPDSITSLGDGSFAFCYALTKVAIPSSITSIGEMTFMYCESLTSVTIPSSVTFIGNGAFAWCTSLSKVTLPSSVTSIDTDAFAWCGLTSMNIPNSVTHIGDGAFYHCYKMTSLTLPSKITYIDEVTFEGCWALTSITIPNGVTALGKRAFYRCEGVSSITIPNSVKSIGEEALASCHFTSITIPNSVTSIGPSAFCLCTHLKSITIPSSVTSIGKYAFDSCTSLTSVTIPSSVTSIGSDIFRDCSSLTTIRVKSGSYAYQWCLSHGYGNKVVFY